MVKVSKPEAGKTYVITDQGGYCYLDASSLTNGDALKITEVKDFEQATKWEVGDVKKATTLKVTGGDTGVDFDGTDFKYATTATKTVLLTANDDYNTIEGVVSEEDPKVYLTQIGR